MEDVREEHTAMDELLEGLSDLDEILHNAKNEVKKLMEKKDKLTDLLNKMKEVEKEKDRFQDMFEEGKIKNRLENERILDEMEKLKEERDKYENIVNLIKKPGILSEACDDVFIDDQGKMSVNDPTDDIVENNNASVSKSIRLLLEGSMSEKPETVEDEDESRLFNNKLKLRINEKEEESVESVELVNRIGDDGVIAVMEIIDELLEDSFTWNPISMESGTELNL